MMRLSEQLTIVRGLGLGVFALTANFRRLSPSAHKCITIENDDKTCTEERLKFGSGYCQGGGEGAGC